MGKGGGEGDRDKTENTSKKISSDNRAKFDSESTIASARVSKPNTDPFFGGDHRQSSYKK